MSATTRVLTLTAVLLTACGGSSASRAPSAAESIAHQRAASESLLALQRSEFDKANSLAERALAGDSGNAWARAVHAIVTYKRTIHEVVRDFRTLAASLGFARDFDFEYFRYAIDRAERGLATVEADLAVAWRDPRFAMDMCLACWKVDWNHDGEISETDERLLEVELDGHGEPLPDGDPRRRPTFRLDHGDVAWARAMVSFQRAALQLASAYEVPNASRVLFGAVTGFGRDHTVRMILKRPAAIAATRALIFAGLKRSGEARDAYLTETDDANEWLPNPRQKSHPLPMPVDEALYTTWKLVLADLEALLAGTTALSVAEMAQLGDHQHGDPPQGYISIATILGEAHDLEFDLSAIMAVGGNSDAKSTMTLMRLIFGRAYVSEATRSPLLQRMRRMKQDVLLGHESLEQKLRYMLWLN